MQITELGHKNHDVELTGEKKKKTDKSDAKHPSDFFSPRGALGAPGHRLALRFSAAPGHPAALCAPQPPAGRAGT